MYNEYLKFKEEILFLSPVGLISECEREIDDSIKENCGFILYLEKRHIEANLPESSIEGKNIRRLAILLDRNPNVKYLIYIKEKNKEKPIFKNTLEDLKKLVEGTLFEEKLECLYKRGRFKEYNYKKKDVKELFDGLENIVDIYYNTEDLRNEIINCFDKVEEIHTEKKEKDFFPVSKEISQQKIKDFYESDITEINEIFLCDSISDVVNICRNILFERGKIVRDAKEIGRLQLNEEIVLKLKAVKKDKLNEYLKSIGFTEGEEEIYGGYYNSIFCTRILKNGKEAKPRDKQLIEELEKAIKSDLLGSTNTFAPIFVCEDCETKKKVKTGWMMIRAYVNKKNSSEKYIISTSHDLRSVDIFDGLPINIALCFKISNDLIEKLKRRSIDAELGYFKMTIFFLHAYLDDIPKGIIEEKLKDER